MAQVEAWLGLACSHASTLAMLTEQLTPLDVLPPTTTNFSQSAPVTTAAIPRENSRDIEEISFHEFEAKLYERTTLE